jgi:phage terminase large subunit GpA-like protein
MQTAIECLNAARRYWRPPPDLRISEWAERYGVLPAESSSESGKWRAIPYQVALMDACCHPRIERVTNLKSARTGYTKCIGHVIGYYVHQDPCSILVVQPTLDDAEGWSKEELMPMIEQTEVLREIVAPSKTRDTSNTILRKRYPGGFLRAVGANSARGFRRLTVRIVLFEELDGYPPSAGNEGDQEKLGEMRTETAWNRKIIKGSTPTEAGYSRIGRSWRESSQGHYLLTCPSCGVEHVRRFQAPESSKIPGMNRPVVIRGERVPISWLDPATACWVCPGCAAQLDHGRHRDMIKAGRWLGEDWQWSESAGFEFLPTFSGHIGFHIWAGYSYSPNSTPEKLLAEYAKVADNPDQLKTFVNTVLGEEWTEPGEQLDWQALRERAEAPSDRIDDKIVALTMGADVQGDRIEYEIVGWAAGEESWSVEYDVIVGDTTQDEVWAELLEVWKDATFTRRDGLKLRVDALAVDSGYLPKRVYRFVRLAKSLKVWPIKGRAGAYPIVEDRLKRQRRLARQRMEKIHPEWLGVDEAKTVLMRRLKYMKPGPGMCHMPGGRDDEWYRQLTGERLITRYSRLGSPIREWVRIHSAVEALDCRVYAHAALLLSDVDLSQTREVAQQGATARIKRRASSWL